MKRRFGASGVWLFFFLFWSPKDSFLRSTGRENLYRVSSAICFTINLQSGMQKANDIRESNLVSITVNGMSCDKGYKLGCSYIKWPRPEELQCDNVTCFLGGGTSTAKLFRPILKEGLQLSRINRSELHSSSSFASPRPSSPLCRNQRKTIMPSATSPPPQSLDSILHTLHQTLHHPPADPTSVAPLLSRAKLTLLHSNTLIPSPSIPPQTLALARSILEASALLSIRARDPESFVRYYSQLQPFYHHQHPSYPVSPDCSKITGLYLLLLLSEGNYAEFHTVLEGLVVAEQPSSNATAALHCVEDDGYIKYPVELERSLMEGSYDQVWRRTRGGAVPGPEFELFSDVCTPLFPPPSLSLSISAPKTSP